jgi:ABC-2 type transport system ATP-binding protein
VSIYGVIELVVRYGSTVAVDGVSFGVEPGGVVAIVGGDGAGKTSVLRALAGAIAPAGGEVRRPGDLEIGYVPADSGVYKDLTTVENLQFAGAAYGLEGAELEESIDGLLAATRLDQARDRLAGDLSGGMRQKLALACALAHRPRLLVLDEATTGVDPVSRADLWRYIARAAAAGSAVVFSTSYLNEAERAAHVLALDSGRTLVQGTPAQIVASVAGAIFEVDQRPSEGLSYRRGRKFRVWEPGGVGNGQPVKPDLQDAVTVAALQARTAGVRP